MMVMVPMNEPLPDPTPVANFHWKDREAWSAFGRCNGLGEKASKIFFPEQGGNTKQAKKICEKCPVKKQCLAYALHHGEGFGIWGGLTVRERRKLTRGFE